MGILFIIGVVVIAIGLLALFGLLDIGLPIAVALVVIGLLLVVFDRAGWVRR